MKAKKERRSWTQICGRCCKAILVVVLLFGILLGVSVTPWGLRLLTPILASHLSARFGLEMRIAGLALHCWPFGVSVQSLSAQWNDLELVSESPLHLVMQPGRFHMQPWTVRVGEGKLRAEGGIANQLLDVKVDILDFPLHRFGFIDQIDPGAELEGQITLTGTMQDPVATMQLDVHGLRPEDPALWDGPPARFVVNLALQNQRIKGRFRLENLPGDPVILDLDLPAPLSLSPFSLQWPPQGPITAHLSANTDLAGLGRLFVLDVYHRLTGTLAADIQLTGTFNEPRLAGSIHMAGGQYEHELSGTILRDVTLAVAAERESLSLVNFSASDGSAGMIHASGRMQFRPAEHYPFETTLTLTRFRLMKNDHADAIGQGTLTWNGNLNESRLTGQVRVSPATLNIPETLPPRLYALDVTEVHADEGKKNARTTRKLSPGISDQPKRHRVAFDLHIDAPERVFVRGRGLDSEWSARIQIRGQTPEPLLIGSLNMIRGRFSFFGKRLLLQRGIVTFDGAYPPSPLLDMEASLRSGGIIAILRVQGPAMNPEIELDSSPPLPEDEILARLLFGRETARISPWQAITLAQAVNKLRGGGSAFDLIGETRRILRVDQIDVRTPDETQAGTTITLGKYISDRIYVELERNLAEEYGRTRVEVELTPSLRIETQTGGNADAGIGIIWTRDY
ncbi:MAG: translocation/assembly module TamB domain-containing protein [Kiritimatiellia bacterium]